MKTISIVIPARNEKDGIEKTIRAIPKGELEKMGYEVQILVVDNDSNDGTGELAKKAGADVVFEPRLGYGSAYKAGFAHAKGDIIATADADMTYPVEDIPKFIKLSEEQNLDFITTDRYAYMEKGAMSSQHRLGNAILNLAARLLFQIGLKDSQSGMWVFRKDLLNKAVLKANSMALSEELKIEAIYFLRCNWREFPIQYRVRVGKAKLKTWKDGFGNLFYLIKKRIVR
ncbi:putative glycosyltransferase [subsurface metagenome]|nr:glycosyltransferase [Dehalococcoidia bacterium]